MQSDQRRRACRRDAPNADERICCRFRPADDIFGTHRYPIEASGTKPLKDEAQDHGMLNDHVMSIENIDGNVLWRKQ